MKALTINGQIIATLRDGKWIPIDGYTLADVDDAIRNGEVIDLSEDDNQSVLKFLYGILAVFFVIVIIRYIYLWIS